MEEVGQCMEQLPREVLTPKAFALLMGRALSRDDCMDAGGRATHGAVAEPWRAGATCPNPTTTNRSSPNGL